MTRGRRRASCRLPTLNSVSDRQAPTVCHRFRRHHLVATTADASRSLATREAHAPAPDAMVRRARRRLVRAPVWAPAQAAGGRAPGATVRPARLRRLVPGGAGPWALWSFLSSRQSVALPASLAPAPTSFERSKRSAFAAAARSARLGNRSGATIDAIRLYRQRTAPKTRREPLRNFGSQCGRDLSAPFSVSGSRGPCRKP
jgi:hypothetical protein